MDDIRQCPDNRTCNNEALIEDLRTKNACLRGVFLAVEELVKEHLWRRSYIDPEDVRKICYGYWTK